MFGINQEILNKLAAMQVPHSWLVEILKLKEPQATEAEENLCRWIRDEVRKAYPEITEQYNPVERAIRTALLPLLENQAIAELWVENNPLAEILPRVWNVGEAQELANADVNYTMTKREREMAGNLLEKMQDETLKPELSRLIPR